MPQERQDHWLLNAKTGWRAAGLERVVAVDDLRLQTRPGAARPLVDAQGSFGGLELPTGMAVDADDRVYILDGRAHLVKRFDPCTRSFEALPCIGEPGSQPRQLRSPRGLAISRRGDLYIADTDNRRVQVFALKGLPLRAIWGPFKVIREEGALRVEPSIPVRSPAGEADCSTGSSFLEGTWRPWDIALACDSRAYVSDYDNGLIHVFDSSGRWRAAFTGEPGEPLERPTHIALDKVGNVYVVQEGKDYVVVLDTRGGFLRRVEQPQDVGGSFCPIDVTVDDAGNVYLSERFSRRVYLYRRSADGCFTCSGACREFDGLGMALAFDRAGNPLVGDAAQRRVFRLGANAAYETEGRYITDPLDSHIYRCQWHRVLLRAAIRPGTQVRVDTFTSESPKTPAEIRDLPDARWATGQIDAQVGEADWDCLILSPPGRYLWLRLALIGEGTETPAVQWVEVYYDRASSLRYLPAVYQEDGTSRDFVDRFLSIFDTIREGIADRIAGIARYFDPAATPADGARPGDVDFLTWLASWLDLTLERHWPEERRRQLVKHAHKLYALRGTPEGLRLHVQLYTGVEPRILEHFKLRRWLYVDEVRLGAQSAVWGREVVRRLQLGEFSQIGSFQLIDSGDPLRDPFHHSAHQFTVFVPLRGPDRQAQRQTIERIVEMAKPAHTLGRVLLTEPRLRVGVQAFVGVDTVIGRYPDELVEGKGRLGYDTVLGLSPDEAGPPPMRVGVRSRIGSSTLID